LSFIGLLAITGGWCTVYVTLACLIIGRSDLGAEGVLGHCSIICLNVYILLPENNLSGKEMTPCFPGFPDM